MRRLTLVLMLVAGLAACDSATPDPTPGPGPGPGPGALRAFTVADLPTVEAVEMRDTVQVALPVFGGPSDAPVLTVTASSELAILSQGATVQVRALAEGDGTLSVRASADGFRDTTVTIPVRVTPGVCPPEPAAGLHDVFPFENGQTWAFDVRTASGTLSTGVQWTERGRLDATFQNVHCFRGARRGEVRYRFAITGIVEVYPVSEVADHTIRFTTPSFYGYSRTVTFGRYQSAPTLEVRHPACAPAWLAFDAGVGLSLEYGSCYHGSASGFGGRRMERVL